MVPEQSPLVILDIKSDMCMPENGKDTKHTIHISIIIHFVRNGEYFSLHKTWWCEGGLKFEYIGANNFREDELNPIF